MALTPIVLGSSPNDGNGDTLRAGGTKINLIISELWDTVTAGISYIAGFTGIGTETPTRLLELSDSNTDTNHGMRIVQEGTGDAMYAYLTGSQGWAHGVDNSDSDSFKISTSSTDVGSNTVLKILTDGGVLMPALKSGANQGAAGAAADEIWVDTADQTLKIGV